nr:SGNH/GDSL hydrolase family protein [Parabacteroides sp.]
RQPEAKIKVVGILPRRDTEKKVADLNKRIQQLTKEDGYSFTDVSRFLLLSNGKIDESLFTDGLHPNAKGYSLIAKGIAE